MPDTGQAAGQQVEIGVRLTQSGTALSYANKAAFEAAGWSLKYRAAQAEQTPTYTLAPWTAMGDGWHLIVLTLVNGQGPLAFKKPSTGSGWKAFPAGGHVGAEDVDQDQIYNALLASVGVAPAASLVTLTDFEVVEGDSFARESSVLASAVTAWGYTVENLADGTLTLTANARATDNRVGIPSGWLAVTVVTATTGSNPILRLSWLTFPAAVPSIQEGMGFGSSDPADDADVSPAGFLYDVQASATKTWAVTGVNAGAKQFTVNGDQRRWFAVGGTIAKTGTDAGTYTITAVSYAGGATTVTVSQTITVGTVDGNLTAAVVFTLLRGTITVRRQETR